VTVPVVIVLALVLARPGHHADNPATPTSGTTGPRALPPVTVPAPPPNPAADAPCTKLLSALPITLGDLPSRPAPSTWTYVVAWGDPAVVLRCGVPRPTALRPASADLDIAINGVLWLAAQHNDKTVWTSVDRAAYIEVTVPKSYAQPPLGPISNAITKTLPAVCVAQAAPGQPAVDPKRLCTNRV
jgi:uncharacterized protein DUF3515